MKKLLIPFIAIACISCKEDTKVDYALLNGKITNKPAGDFTINSFDGLIKDPIAVTEDGSFADTLKVKEGTYVLYDGTNPTFIYLEHGANLSINYDAKDFKNSIKITGNRSEASNYLQSKKQKEKELFGNNPGELYALDETAYKTKLNDYKTELIDLVASTKNIPDNFINQEKRSANYFYLFLLTQYERAHAHFSKQPGFKTSGDFLAELNTVDYNNGIDFEFSPEYKQLVTLHYKESISEVMKTDSLDYNAAFFKVAKTITNETIKNGLIFDFAKNGLTYAKDLKIFYNDFMAVSTNEAHKAELTKSYNKLKALAKGEPSPTFVDYENFKGGKTSLSDLKGKYVYVDVWATWCGPCKREIPFLKDVEQKYHGKDIEFVSISVDKAADYDKWKQMIVDQDLKGIQLFANNSWNSDFVQGYQITGIPRFILIDPEGNIVSSNAPRPSNPELVKLFTSLNI
ncbi:TlpA disulfide reductase family protein [Snuella lapsa]|uniref:Thioredoxin domain-containing protein n=1 Tax=Snuella lapsa TaxID=870481 RepID=A0ABP6XTY0_9FLAO